MTGSAPSAGKYPSWAQEIHSLLPTSGLFCISGNVRDVFLSPQLKVRGLPDLLREMFAGLGFTEIAVVRAAGERRTVESPDGDGQEMSRDETVEELWARATETASYDFPEVPVGMLGALTGLLNTGGGARALLVLDASRAVTRPGSLNAEESQMFREVRRAVDDQQLTADRGFNPLVWVVDTDHDVPTWLCGGNPRGRSVSIPLPTASDRDLLAGRILAQVRDRKPTDISHSRRTMVDQTDGLPLRSVAQILTLARQRGDVIDELDDAIRVFRLGVLENPWKQPYLADRLRAEVRAGEGGELRQRIRGQDAAIGKSLDVLVRSVTGLRSAQVASRSGKPRGVLFFAGPTGVGKTELAKGLASLLFGDEGSMIRFDMSEFASEQAAERLVGAPPGYVGFAQGGELTNAVRQRPFSLLLFDEIEKADHQVLDRFLQILDDGRLTDGRGETTYFTETVIIFTSNLGIYNTVKDSHTGMVTGRTLAVKPSEGYEALAKSVADRVRDHFTSVVGRPELLNRIGDNIVVFNFIKGDVARAILAMMLDNVERTFARECGASLDITSEARARIETECLTAENLMMGGRGIGNLLESVLVDPLARWTFDQDSLPDPVVVDDIKREGYRYVVRVRGQGER